jgi:hypothetical protein
MKEIIFDYKGRNLNVIYIEYHGRRPHSVETACFDNDPNNTHYIAATFDFEKDCAGCEKFMYYNSGMGGSYLELQPPQYSDGAKGTSYWMHPKAKFKGVPKNITKRDKPIKYKGNPNPFDFAREIFDVIYCKKCKAYYDENACPTHQHFDWDNEDAVTYADSTIED